MEFIIRNIEEKDIRQIAELNIEDRKTFYRGIIDDECLDALSVEEKMNKILSNYKQNHFIVAANGDEVYGYCRYAEHSLSFPDDPTVDSELCELYVRANIKGKGIGSAIVDFVKNNLKSYGKKKMIVCCLEKNYPARGFYEKMGGKLYGENKYEAGGKLYNEVVYIYDL